MAVTWNASIVGRTLARPEQLRSYARRENPNAPDLAGLYVAMAERLGVRGDVAYAQAVVDTNCFRLEGLLERGRYNFAGLGVTQLGEPGVSFRSPEEGVLAHLQALYFQASRAPLPPGMPDLVPFLPEDSRGQITHVGALRRPGWPGDTGYGEAVARTLAAILLEPVEGDPFQIQREYLPPGAPGRPGAWDSEGAWRGVEGIVVHRSASPRLDGAGMREVLERSVGGEPRSYHFVVDDQAIRQLVPVGEIAFHTSGRNHRDIGVMICEHNWGMPEWEEAYRRLVWLVARLTVVFQVRIECVSGHFWWDPVRHPYDPTHLCWRLEDGPATGLFNWNRFVADVVNTQREVEKTMAGPAAGQDSDAADTRPAVTRRPAEATARGGCAAGRQADTAAAPGGGAGEGQATQASAAGGRAAARPAARGGTWVEAAIARVKSRRYGSRRR